MKSPKKDMTKLEKEQLYDLIHFRIKEFFDNIYWSIVKLTDTDNVYFNLQNNPDNIKKFKALSDFLGIEWNNVNGGAGDHSWYINVANMSQEIINKQVGYDYNINERHVLSVEEWQNLVGMEYLEKKIEDMQSKNMTILEEIKDIKERLLMVEKTIIHGGNNNEIT